MKMSTKLFEQMERLMDEDGPQRGKAGNSNPWFLINL